MIRAIVLIMLSSVCLILAGCATTANYEKILQSWIDHDADDLISRLGPPDKTSTLSDGGRVIEYVRSSNMQLGGYTYTTPQTTYHSGSASAYNNYGGSAYGTYSGTSTTYIQQQSPVYNIPLVCITQFRISPGNKIIQWQWQGNSCKALPPKQNTIVSPAFQQKYVDMQKVVSGSQYGKKAEELLRAFEKEQEVIIGKKTDMGEEMKSAGDDKALDQKTSDQYVGPTIDSQDHVKLVRKYLNEFVYRQARRAAQEVANRNNYDISYEIKSNMDDISGEVINEIDRLPTENVEIYFQNIK
jgi:hypothetical protein